MGMACFACPRGIPAHQGTCSMTSSRYSRRMKWNVLITSKAIVEVGEEYLELLRQSDCVLHFPQKFGARGGQDLLDLLDGKDAVLATVDKFTREVIQHPSASGLKIISRWGVGYDSVDVPAATDHGLVVAYTPGLLDETVADLTFALILGIARRIPQGDSDLRNNIWQPLWGHNVHKSTLGLVGCGRIGLAVAKRARGFDMKILAYDVNPSQQAVEAGVQFVSLEDLLQQSHFVSLHAAMTPENKGMLGESQFRMMRKNAYLINAARGPLIDEMALVKALNDSWIAGAALDTYTVEPLPHNSPLRHCPNLLLSPHQASYTHETGRKVSMTAAQAIIDLKNGIMPKFALNPEVLTKTLRTKIRTA